MDTLLTLIHSLASAAHHIVSGFFSAFLWTFIIAAFVALRLYREKQRNELARLALEKGVSLPPRFFRRD